jgi:hypothetical protein
MKQSVKFSPEVQERGRASGRGGAGSARLAVAGDRVHRGQDRLHGRDATPLVAGLAWTPVALTGLTAAPMSVRIGDESHVRPDQATGARRLFRLPPI